MRDREQALGLLEVAARELKALKGMNDAETFTDEVFGFLAQQAIEKSLKAWLCLLGLDFPLTHDLTALLAHLQNAGQDVHDLWELAEYNPFAVELRYSSLTEYEAPIDRTAAVSEVESLIHKVQALIQ